MPEAISSKKLTELIPGLEGFPVGFNDTLASLANVAGETFLNLGRLNLTPEQSEEVTGIITRTLGQAAITGVELRQKTTQPLELEGLIALSRLIGAAIKIGIANVTRPTTPESAVSPLSVKV